MTDEYKLQIFLARHGESFGNIQAPPGAEKKEKTEAEIHDPELTDLGLEQAGLLGERLSCRRFDRILTSPMKRAVGTAYEVFRRQPGESVPVEIMPELLEAGAPWDYPWPDAEEINRLYPGLNASRTSLSPSADWAEREEEDKQTARLDRARLCAGHIRSRFCHGERVFIVAHGTYNTYLIRAFLGLSNENDFNFCQENTGLTKIKYFTGGGVRLSYSNDTSHLYAINSGLAFML